MKTKRKVDWKISWDAAPAASGWREERDLRVKRLKDALFQDDQEIRRVLKTGEVE